jgi:uncharacterized protein YPO0396
LGARIAGADEAIAAIRKQRDAQAARARAAQSLVNLDWADIDVASVLGALDTARDTLCELREGNADLKELGQRIAAADQRVADARRQWEDTRAERRDHQREHTQREGERERARSEVEAHPLTPFQHEGLEARCNETRATLTLDNLERRIQLIERALHTSVKQVEAGSHEQRHRMLAGFEAFCRRWPADAGDVRVDTESAPDFFARLTRLQRDGLPQHENRFFDMLRTQSSQNLVALQTYMRQAYKAIRARMEDVNAGLEQVPFDRDSTLQIHPEDRGLAEVRDFRRDLADILSQQRTEDRARAEAQFEGLRKLVARLSSNDPEDRRWRARVLDVRLHVEFIGEERDSVSGEVVQLYRSGAGKSGGQRQKLTTFCLAAALRYQLGDEDGGVPPYAAVVLDEAFDKADNEFTTMAMNIFENFGFQMIVATPLKSVMTLEPFIGGACFVEISGRHDSGVLMIEYDTASRRLALPREQHETADAPA